MKIGEKIKEIVLEQLKIDSSLYHDDLAAGDIPEWDSLGHVNLLMAVENYFEVSFDVSDAIDVETIADLIETTKKYVSAKG
jgi:acyl carrier protein